MVFEWLTGWLSRREGEKLVKKAKEILALEEEAEEKLEKEEEWLIREYKALEQGNRTIKYYEIRLLRAHRKVIKILSELEKQGVEIKELEEKTAICAANSIKQTAEIKKEAEKEKIIALMKETIQAWITIDKEIERRLEKDYKYRIDKRQYDKFNYQNIIRLLTGKGKINPLTYAQRRRIWDEEKYKIKKISGITIKEQNLQGFSLDNLEITNVEFIECHLRRTSFKNAFLENVKFIKTHMINTNFTEAIMRNIDFTETSLKMAIFKNAIITEKDLETATEKPIIERKKPNLKRILTQIRTQCGIAFFDAYGKQFELNKRTKTLWEEIKETKLERYAFSITQEKNRILGYGMTWEMGYTDNRTQIWGFAIEGKKEIIKEFIECIKQEPETITIFAHQTLIPNWKNKYEHYNKKDNFEIAKNIKKMYLTKENIRRRIL